MDASCVPLDSAVRSARSIPPAQGRYEQTFLSSPLTAQADLAVGADTDTATPHSIVAAGADGERTRSTYLDPAISLTARVALVGSEQIEGR